MKKLLLAIIVVTGLAIPVHAYITQRRLLNDAIVQTRWLSFPVTWRLVPTQGARITGTRTQAQVAQTSFNTWEAITTATIDFTRGADTEATTTFGFDEVNVLKTNLTTQAYANSGAGGALAITLISAASLTGQILDADIIFDPDFSFSTNSGTIGATDYDFEGILTHEIGHLLGLDHSAILSATMYPRLGLGNISARVLAPDDIAGVSSIYPSSSYLTRGSLSGTVRLTSNATVYGAVVVAVNSSGQPAGHGVTDNRGNYVINGLPAGTYQVFAEPMDSPYNFSDQGVLETIYRSSAISTGFTTRFR